jgi:hypothetical protein
MTRSAPAGLRPLPRTVPPFPGEPTASHLRRLALANRLAADALSRYITGDRRRSGPYSLPPGFQS